MNKVSVFLRRDPATMPKSNADINLTSYERLANMLQYTNRSLQPPEARLLLEILSKSQNLNVIDIGCGGGRFYFFLRGLVDSYTGIDYSQAALRVCHDMYPEGDFRAGDMRDLSSYTNKIYDLVIAAYNSIDTLNHVDRNLALSEIRQLLRPGGLFMFSSHNLSHLRTRQFRFPRPPLTMNVCRLIPALLSTSKHWWRFLRLKRFEQLHPEFEIIVDGAHEYELLTYFIDRNVQERQLMENGFVLKKALDRRGRELAYDDKASDSGWIYYLAEAV